MIGNECVLVKKRKKVRVISAFEWLITHKRGNYTKKYTLKWFLSRKSCNSHLGVYQKASCVIYSQLSYKGSFIRVYLECGIDS